MKVQLEMSEDQAYVIQDALDFYSRIMMGQFDNIASLFSIRLAKNVNREEETKLIEALKNLYYPELHRSAYYGIFHSDTPEDAKISWDLIQVLRYDISWYKYPEGGHTVNFHTPLRSSNTEELAKVKIIEE